MQKAIEETEKIEKCMGEEVEVTLEYGDFEKLKYYCEKTKITIKNIKYAEDIVCILEILEGQLHKILKDLELKSIKIKEWKLLSKNFITKINT